MSGLDEFLKSVYTGVQDIDKRQGNLAAARQKARDGDPMPLAMLQWPAIKWDNFQVEFLTHFFRPDIYACCTKGSTGAGKGAMAAQAIVLYYDIWRDAKIILTSSTIEHCINTLYSEVRRWWNQCAVRPKGAVGKEAIFDNEEHYILPVNPANEEAFSGKHSGGGHTLFGFDEANAVAPDRWDNAGDQANKLMAISNPRTSLCRFRSMFPSTDPDTTQVTRTPRGNVFCQTISALELMNYREKRLAKPMGPVGGIQIADKWFDYGESIPASYYAQVKPLIPGQRCYDEVQADLQSRDRRRIEWQVYARFPVDDAEVQVIQPRWLKRHVQAWQDHANEIEVNCFGLDVAASREGDSTILSAGGYKGCKAQHSNQAADTMDTIAWVHRITRETYGIDLTRDGWIAVDMGGVGKGVGDRLRESGVNVVEYLGAMTANINNQYYHNLRAQVYGELGARLDPDGQYPDPWPIPPDEMLHEELVVPEKIYLSSGKYRLTPKTATKQDQPGRRIESVKEKLGRSPDRADSLTLLYLAVQVAGGEETPTINRPLLLLPEGVETLLAPDRIPESSPWKYTSLELMEKLERGQLAAVQQSSSRERK